MEDIRTVVQGLEEELSRRRRARGIRWLVTVLVVATVIGGFVLYKKKTAPPPEPQFVTAPVEVRDIVEEVQSTGVVEPVNQVEVGVQVSGRIVSVAVDFNDEVKAGQLLAEIDPELFGADVAQQNAQLLAAEAAVRSAEARQDAVETRLKRLKLLVSENIASLTELEQVQGEYDVAVAEVSTTRAQIAQIRARLSSARTTLKYTKIYSPIDGVVINRQVEPGQTVAASFNTPVLFLIARDLNQMRVLAEIDEADVGKVQEGMGAQVTVDAFPEEEFAGTLTQIRLSPNNVEGVVTYSAVILVENRDGKLRPGMTATAKVTTREARQVLAVRNSALRFEPLPPVVPGERAPSGAPPPSAKPPSTATLPRPARGQGRVFLVGRGPVEAPGFEAKLVDVGITDGVWSELRGGLAPGAQVIVDERPSGEKRGFRLF